MNNINIKTSNELYNESIDYINKNNITYAIKSLEKSIEYNNENIEALNLLGTCKYLFCEFNEAYKYFKKSNDIEPENIYSLKYINYIKSDEFNQMIHNYNQGIICLHKEKLNEAEQIFKNILDIDYNLIEPKIIISLINLYRENIDDAKQYIEEVLTIDTNNEQALFIKSKYLINYSIEVSKYKVVERKKIYKNCLAAIIIATIFSLVYSNYEAHNIRKEYINKIKLISEENTLLNEDLKILEEKNNENEKKIQVYINENQNEIFNKANQYIIQKEYKQATKLLNDLIQYGQDEIYISEAIYLNGVSYEKQKNYKEALNCYKQYIERYNNDSVYYDDALYRLGNLYFENNELDKSKKVFKELKNICGDSIYNNSRVDEILNN